MAVNSWLATSVDTLLLGPSNPLGLPFASYTGLELSEHGQHSEEGAACRSARIDALFYNSEMRSRAFYFVSYVRKIAQRSA
jgi:hypothetical protein